MTPPQHRDTRRCLNTEASPPEHRDKRRCLNTEATPPSHPCIGTHEVFISHRGIAMKRAFASHLYHSLKSRGIKAFLDMEELPEGEDVRPFMLEGARRAIIQVPIFTRDYAESRWCLDELVEMMKSFRLSKAKVFPVFYDVKSEDLRNENGPFAEAIKAHRGKGKHNEDTIKGWEDALCDASWLEGFRLETYNRFEGALCQALVEKIVQQMQDRTPVEDDLKAVGLEERVHAVLELFQLKEKEIVSFVLLWGMGGIGKTTLARAIHKRLGKEFQAASFVKNCRDRKLSELQDCLLHDLLLEKNFSGDDVDKRRERLKHGLREKKVLIILDDAENFDSIEEIIDLASLKAGSIMLVTSRDRTVFPHDNVLSNVFRGERYEVQGMDSDESLRLFCLNAFKKPSPDLGFQKLAEKVSQGCAGLPLSLEVLGRHLRSKKEEIWEEAIKSLSSSAALHKRIETSLKISYDALSGHEQEMFLDVACFLIGRDRQSAKYFWDSDDLVEWPRSGLERLIDLCLVKVDEAECLTMHDHLRDLGRGIVKQSGKWSRVWDDTTLSQVLQSKQGLDQIRGIATSQRILNASSLCRMRSLRLLFLDGTKLNCGDEGLKGLEIRWLIWNVRGKAPSKVLLDLEFLTVLELGSSMQCIHQAAITRLPSSFGQLKKLRKLNMKECSKLKELPEEFGSLESLEELHVGLSAITRLPSSFAQLKKLRMLYMIGCYKLEELPEEFGSLESLEELHVGFLAITRLPSSFGQLRKLRKLYMEECSELEELPEEFGSLESLEELDVGLSAITRLPSSFAQLKKLRMLYMIGCSKLEELLEEFGSLESLEELHVGYSAITRLPSSFGQLKKLRMLDMVWCSKLEELPEEFGSLESLEELHVGYSAITRLPSSFGQLKKLRKLNMKECSKLKELPEEFGSEELHVGLSAITRLPSSFAHVGLSAITRLPSSFAQLKKLRMLYMIGCSKLEELPEEFGSLESLEELHVGFLAITRLPSSFGQLRKLRKLYMEECSELEELPEEFGSLESLEELHVGYSAITRLPSSFGQLKKLRKLNMKECSKLKELPEEFGSEELHVGLSAITRLPSSFGQLKKLRMLDMVWCSKLEELPEEFGSLESLEELHVGYSAITRLPSSFGQLTKLRMLDMDWCSKLEELPEEFGSLESLEELDVGLSAITRLPSSFAQLKKLRKLEMDWCSKLEGLPEDFGSLESLEVLRARGSAITRLPSSFGQLKVLAITKLP